jgi:hypothetical protein
MYDSLEFEDDEEDYSRKELSKARSQGSLRRERLGERISGVTRFGVWESFRRFTKTKVFLMLSKAIDLGYPISAEVFTCIKRARVYKEECN